MKIRTKLTLSMSVLIGFILLCLFVVTHVQFYIVRDLAYWDEMETFTALRSDFENYYRENGGSWDGIGDKKFANDSSFVEMALVAGHELIYKKGRIDLPVFRDEAFPLILKADGQRIGILFVMNERQYKTYEFKTMWYGIFPSVARVSLILTGVVALLIVWLLSWRLTSPIRKMIKGIDAIKKGEPEPSFPVHRKDEFGAISRTLKEMSESIQNLEQSRKQMLSDVAHELKTPLMIMQGELELAQELDKPVSREKLASLLDEVLRLSRLVHDVLELSKLEAGRTELRPTTENITKMAEEIIDKVCFIAEEKQIDISLQASDPTVEAPVEKYRIVQAVYNILTNALQYTNPGGRVQVGVERAYLADRRSEYVQISIADNGIGISPDDLPHIFNRFYRADASRTRPSGGTGLGLAIAQQNIRLHRGWVEARSEPGKGTTFIIYLPAAGSDEKRLP